MSRGSDRRDGRILGGPSSAATRQHDDLLTPGMIVNGVASKVGEGDELTSLVRARCGSCGQVVAVAWLNMPHASSTRRAVFYVEAQAVDRLTPLPVRVRMVDVDLSEVTEVYADCTAHGRITLQSDSLLSEARRVVARKSGKMRTLNATPDGTPVGHDLTPGGVSIDEMARLLGWKRSPTRGE